MILFGRFIWILIGLILLFEISRDVFKVGDFQGYVETGKLALHGKDIYTYFGNTWPPFFSVFAVLITYASYLLGTEIARLIWLLAILLSYFGSLQLLFLIIFEKKIEFKNFSGNAIQYYNPIVWFPLLIILRYFLDNLANVQINPFLLFASLLLVRFYQKKQIVLLSFILAFTISLKVVTLFFFLYFIYKKEWRILAWTFLFLVLINGIALFFFGFELALNYYQTWADFIIQRGYKANHKNQSIFGLMLRFLTIEPTRAGWTVNVLEYNLEEAKLITKCLITVLGVITLSIFHSKKREKSPNKTIHELFLVCSSIPLITPLAWKAYFLFLWPGVFMVFLHLFGKYQISDGRMFLFGRIVFMMAILFLVCSSEIFVGPTFAKTLEKYSIVTIGGILLILNQFLIYLNLNNFKNSLKIKS